jgi:high affinity Mn2+ porin
MEAVLWRGVLRPPQSVDRAREELFPDRDGLLGLAAMDRGELYFDPELAQGIPFSNFTGLAGFPNGELAKTSGAAPTLYRARLFFRQTWGFGGETKSMESDANQLAGAVYSRRLVVTAGNLSVSDLFDNNAYSHDPRLHFLNWSFTTHGAYDYAADARGYSWGVALEYFYDEWAIRFGRFLEPKEPNQLPLDHQLFQHYGDQIELEHAHALGGQPGKLRLLAFRNRAKMARYGDALPLAAQSGTVPDLNAVRTGEHIKYGFGVNLEQAVTADVGVFARIAWADGQTETYAFTEIDSSASGGVAIKGARWHRDQDTLGFAIARNRLSSEHRDYLAEGGLGFFIGDGRLNYRPETIFETYYSLNPVKGVWIALDYQRISNPAYNADRGPVNVGSIRLHTQF